MDHIQVSLAGVLDQSSESMLATDGLELEPDLNLSLSLDALSSCEGVFGVGWAGHACFKRKQGIIGQ